MTMPAKKYIVTLSPEEREELLKLTKAGEVSARKMKRAQILLKSDEGWKDREIIGALNTSGSTVERIRKRYVEGGLEKALNDDPRPGAKRKLEGRGEAYLLALTCSEAPDDHDHWALRLLADKLVEVGAVESISHETVRQALKKMN
jgi:transposase